MFYINKAIHLYVLKIPYNETFTEVNDTIIHLFCQDLIKHVNIAII